MKVRGLTEPHGDRRKPPLPPATAPMALRVGREKRRKSMFVNCYDGYGLCLFAVRVKEGVEPKELGNHIYNENELIDFWRTSDEPEAAVVRY
jgi:hypothetical protein